MASADQSLKWPLVFLLFVLLAILSGPSPGYAQNDAQNDAGIERQIAAAQAKLDNAIAQVKAIVNRPVDHLTRTPDMRVGVFSPGWFHEGAIKPDFATVDIRATQELIYAKYTYVTSDLTPGEVFIGDQLEFNSMTKYFYVDRTVPKARLSESEMLQINQLYRTIAQSTRQLEQLKGSNSGWPFTQISEFSLGVILVVTALIFGGLCLLWPILRRR
ncbi:MAG TPA: hypothetical protein VHW90_02190 [Stellaceae bacterium]|nr:hypothetical protein [Stellaceae bacterium]